MILVGTSIILWCFVQGSSSIFKVNIGTKNDIDDLKEAIKIKKPNDTAGVDPDKLRLWSVNVASISDISEEMLIDDKELKDERSTIENTFFGIEESNIRVVIKIPVNEQRSTKRQKIGDPSFEGILEIVASLKRNKGSSTSTDTQLQDVILSSNNELFVVEESALYIRQAYKDLYRIITDPEPDPRILITGTSGVGKSCFLIYLLIQLLCNVDNVTIIFQPCQGNLLYCFENSSLIVGEFENISNRLYRSETWFLVDSVAPALVKARTVVAVSPNSFKDDQFQEFSKRVVSKYCMPPWTIKELSTCRQLVFSQVPEDLMLDIADIAGGVPRYVLQTPARLIKKYKNPSDKKTYDIIVNKSMERIEEAILEIKNFNDLVLCFTENASFVKISSRIIHRWPDPSYEDHYFQWASSYIYDRIMRKLEKFRWDELLQKIQNPLDLTNARGIMFELYVIHHFTIYNERGENFGYDMRRLKDNTRTRINIRVNKDKIVYVRTPQNLSNYNDDNVAIRPTVKNFGAVDLFITPDYVFQITVSKKHPIKQKKLVKIIQNMAAYRRNSNAIIRLVFVVPDDIYNEFEYQNYVTKKKKVGDDLEDFKDVEQLSHVLVNVEQWVLKIDMSMREQE